MTPLIYLDNAATTPLAPQVLQAMLPFLDHGPHHDQKFGNPSSLHLKGEEAARAVKQSRNALSALLGCSAHELIFTSGGTEANNLAIKGIAFAHRHKGNHIIVSAIEHESILDACRWLETQGFIITLLPVSSHGFVDPLVLQSAITPSTILVSIIHANNEIGTIQDIATLGNICKKNNVLFHTDCCQSFCKVPLDISVLPVDVMTINAHKLNGPKGVGALFLRSGVALIPLLHGGGQERGMRSGTENVAGIVGFTTAAQMSFPSVEAARLRDILIAELQRIPHCTLNGPSDSRLCTNVNVSFADIEGESLVLALSSKGLCASTGAACSSRQLEPSHVLKAIGLSARQSFGSIRLSVGRWTTEEEVRRAAILIAESVKALRDKMHKS